MLTEKRKKSNIKILLATGAIIALLPVLAHAKQGVYIIEPFSCEVALADYAEHQRLLEVTPRTDWKYPIFLDQYKSITDSLDEHLECEVK